MLQMAVRTTDRNHSRNAPARAIERLADAFLNEPSNHDLRQRIASTPDSKNSLSAESLYRQLLAVVQRLLLLHTLDHRATTAAQSHHNQIPQPASLGHLRHPSPANASSAQLWTTVTSLFNTSHGPSTDPNPLTTTTPRSLHLPTLSSDLLSCPDLDNCTIPDHDLLTALDVFTTPTQPTAPAPHLAHGNIESLGTAYESLLAFLPTLDTPTSNPHATPRLRLVRGSARRATGSYYTPPALIQEVVHAALDPIIDERLRDAASPNPSSHAAQQSLLSIRICDPACGSGHFLLSAARHLGHTLARHRAGSTSPKSEQVRRAICDVIIHCIHGVDKNPVAVDLCRIALWLESDGSSQVAAQLPNRIKHGDSLLGVVDLRVLPSEPSARAPAAHATHQPPSSLRAACDHWTAALFAGTPQAASKPDVAPSRDPALQSHATTLSQEHAFFHWPLEFFHPNVPHRFDVVLGNPPWIAHAGRAAQPLHPGMRRFAEATNPAFAKYRTTHGMMIRRAAELIREDGFVGLVVPTSVSDLDGYAPTRAAFDQLCEVHPRLADFGADAFDTVFQPCMALIGRRRTAPVQGNPACWTLRREDLGNAQASLLEYLTSLPTLDPRSFGERGMQTTKAMRAKLISAPTATHTVPIRAGGTIREFSRLSPALFADPSDLADWNINTQEFACIPIVLRQTARYPIATLHDGTVFRNSLLAAFAIQPWTPPALCAYLNSTLIRWLHYTRYRDARQGMPQVKIGHLRSLPSPPRLSAEWLARLEQICQEATQSDELSPTTRTALDAHVQSAFGLSAQHHDQLLAWATAMPR